MSAFVALLGLDGGPVDSGVLEQMTASLVYRAPDGTSTRIDGAIGMGFAQFRTTDQAQYETQPCSLDERTWIVGDVRIDGREDLVRRLGQAPEVDLSRTPDVELVLRAYARWGVDAFAELLGDYSFVLWDGARRELLCVRSPFGMRALYYAEVGGTLIVSNSVHAIRVHGDVTDRLDRDAVADFLMTGAHNTIDKSLTIYRDIRALAPAHALLVQGGRVRVRRYWSFPVDVSPIRYASGRDYVEHFRHVFRESLLDRLRTSKVVLSMSGGLDSTSIGAELVAARRAGLTSTRLQAVTSVFDELPLPRERPYARLAAEALSLPIQFVPADSYGLLSPPVSTTWPVEYYNPAYWVDFERIVASHARVKITGEAGDNVFVHQPPFEGGRRPAPSSKALLNWIRYAAVHRRLPQLGSGLVTRFKPGRSQWPFPEWLAPEFEKSRGLRERFAHWCQTLAEVQCGTRDRACSSLEDVDWNSEDVFFPTSYPVSEARDPFLDVRLLRLVLAVPSVPWRMDKYLLRQAMTPLLPSLLRTRPKTLLGLIHEVLADRSSATLVDAWEPHPELREFVMRDRVATNLRAREDYYADLRPLLMNAWLVNSRR